MNLLDLDVRSLDVPAFLATARASFVLLALLWLVAIVRSRRPGVLLLGVLGANAWVWGVTNYPLQRLYALGPSSDRVGNLALCQVVAAGNPPLQTIQAGQLHFEPFWGLLVAVLSGFSPDRLLGLYPFLPLAVAVGFALSVYWGLKPLEPDGGDSTWERAMAAGFATLLSSSPLDFAGVYRVPWSMTFLLKPNHALGLILFPLVMRTFAGIRTWRGGVAAGALLHLMGWAFVLHMGYTAVGLALFAVLSLLLWREQPRRDLRDVMVVLGVNLLIVSPYLYMLFVGYPFMDPSPRMTIHVSSPHLLETMLRQPAVFALEAWGLAVLWRRGDRLSRVWLAQVLGAHLIWAGYLALSALQVARERDEICYWTRFLGAAAAGIGAWDLGRRALLLAGASLAPARRAALLAGVALPFSLPYWWDPSVMDSYFLGSVAPLSDALRLPTDFLRTHSDPHAVVAGDREYARWVAALGARRVLLANDFQAPKDYARRAAFEERLVRGPAAPELQQTAREYGVRYLVVTPALLQAYAGVELEDLGRRADLHAVHTWRARSGGAYVVTFELLPKGVR